MRALTPPIYRRLAELGESLRQKLRRTLQATGVPTQVTGIASLFGIHFNARPIKSYRDVVTDDAEMTRGLYTGLLNEGILLQTTCAGALGVMTTDTEVDTLVDAVGRVVRRLRE
jgi:glutamate-1-semialdehyde 2,1-aminomutase